MTTLAPKFAITVAASFPCVAAAQCGNPHVHQGLLDLLPDGAPAAEAVQDGPWSDPNTWGGTLPQPGDDVRIPAGFEVVYDINDDGDGLGPDSTRFHFIRVDGTLTWATTIDTTLYVDTLFSSPQGVVEIGTPGAPIDAAVDARIVIIADEPMTDFEQISRGVVFHGPNDIVGASKTPYARLAGDAFAGDSTLELDAAPNGWTIGDTLVLGGTTFSGDGSNDDNSRFRDEVLTITAINGASISFINVATGDDELLWDHVRPDGVHFDAAELSLYVANLSRNIVFESELDPNSPDLPSRGDWQDQRRGHFMTMHTVESLAEHAAFIEFGRLNKNEFLDDPGTNIDGTPGNGLNVRGRYAYHIHRNLPMNNMPVDFDSCTPSEVRGCVVWGSPGWGFVHHDSYAIFEDNVTFDVLGAAFVQEAGNEIGRWEGNLSIKTTGDDDPDLTVEPFGDGYKRVTNFDFGFNGEAYWIQGASQVEFVDNIAISAAGGGANIFSDVDGNSNRDRGVVPRAHLPESMQHIVTNDAQTIAVNRVPANTFSGFEVYNSDFGLLTWNHMRNQGDWIGFTCPCDGNVHREYATLDGFRFWNIYGQGIHLQYSSQIILRHGIIASSDLATPGLDDKPYVDLGINGNGRGYGLGMNGPTKRLVVDDIIIEGWEFGIRTPKEGEINGNDTGKGTGSEGALGLADRRSVFRNLRMAQNGDHMYRRQNGFSDIQAFANFLVIEDCLFDAEVPNEAPEAAIAFDSVGPHGIVKLSGLDAFDADTPNGPTPWDPDLGWLTNYSVAVADPNYIVAYGWDLDNDGTIDAFGEELVTPLPLGEASTIGLTVWDHQGASHSTTMDVTPVPSDYPEMVVDSGFDAPEFNGGSITSGSTDAGWFNAFADLVGGAARLSGQYGFGWTGQAVYDNHVRRGHFTLTYDYSIQEGHANPNNGQISRLRVRVWGINSEFSAAYREYPAPAGAIPYDATLLHDEWLETPTGWTTAEREINVGDDGFMYYMISFHGSGVDSDVADDAAWVDNVSILGSMPRCPQDLTGDGMVDVNDLLDLLSAWGEPDHPADLNGDGIVDVNDLLDLLGMWGRCA